MKKGFTLIEILMVILILGILVAVALPQYELAVDQSRWSTLLPGSRALKDAEERMWMTASRYTEEAGSLDINIPGTYNGNQISSNNGTYSISVDMYESVISATHPQLPGVILEQYLSASRNFPNDLHCRALTENLRASRLCEQLSVSVLGNSGDYTVYLLEGAGVGNLNAN